MFSNTSKAQGDQRDGDTASASEKVADQSAKPSERDKPVNDGFKTLYG